MKLIVNGCETDSGAAHLLALWREFAADLNPASPAGYAIAVNRVIVKAEEWALTQLCPGDRVEILRARSGG